MVPWFPEESNFYQKKPIGEFLVPARNRLTTRNYFLKCLGSSTELVSKKSDFAIWNNHALYSPSAAQSSSEVYKLQFCSHLYFIIYYYNVFLDTVVNPVSNFHLTFQSEIFLVHSATFFSYSYIQLSQVIFIKLASVQLMKNLFCIFLKIVPELWLIYHVGTPA